MYERVISIFNPTPEFSRKLNKLFKTWQKEVVVEMKML
jgi:hypothetical protein